MTSTAADTPRFSLLLRRSTRSDHRVAEGVGFMDALLAGALEQEAYTDLVAQMWLVYSVLEESVSSHRLDPHVGPFHDPALERAAALEADLAHLLGPEWPARLHPTEAVGAYCERLLDVARTWPLGLVAHHYTRYLGDLSGGQMIGREVDARFGFGGGPGATWFAFPDLGDVDRYKARYRDRLDGLDADAVQLDRFVDEVKVAYEMNRRVLDELGERHVR